MQGNRQRRWSLGLGAGLGAGHRAERYSNTGFSVVPCQLNVRPEPSTKHRFMWNGERKRSVATNHEKSSWCRSVSWWRRFFSGRFLPYVLLQEKSKLFFTSKLHMWAVPARKLQTHIFLTYSHNSSLTPHSETHQLPLQLLLPHIF